MQPELERLAREAGLTTSDLQAAGPQLERFALLVAHAENERCADICDGLDYGLNCAAAIRSSAPLANGGEPCS